MKRELLSDAVGMLDADIVDGHFKMKERIKRRKRLRGVIFKTCAAAAVFCLLFAGTFTPEVRERITSSIFFQTFFSPGGDMTSGEITVSGNSPEPWEKFNMSLGVKNGFIRAKDKDTKIAMTVKITDEEEKNAFVYEGKSYAEYVSDREALQARNEELKAAEQTEEVKEEIEKNKSEIVRIADIITKASNAYSVKCAEELFELFNNKGYDVIRKGGTLNLYASYDEILHLDIDDSENIFFDVGRESVFLNRDDTDTQTEPADENAYFKKFQRNMLNAKLTVNNKRELEEVIEFLLQEYKANSIEFNFACPQNTDQGLFENMNYYSIERHLLYMRVCVYENNINIDALIELAKRNEIGSILIEPYYDMLDDEVSTSNDEKTPDEDKSYLNKFKTIPEIKIELKEDKDLEELIEILFRKSETNSVEAVFSIIRNGDLIFDSMIYKRDDIYIDGFIECAKRQDVFSIYIEPCSVNSDDEKEYLSKIKFDIPIKTEIKSDEDIADAIKEMHDIWQYTYDYLEFTFGCAGSVDNGIFENMNYFGEIKRTNLISRAILKVKYEDIDIDALIELLKRDDIVQVTINPPPTYVSE